MSDFTLYILTALSLVFVIEGLTYALFPDAVRKMMAVAVTLPPERLRLFGLAGVACGLSMIWAMRAILRH